MTPAGELLASEIRRNGPITFRRFMQVALYDPEHGYYRRAQDPFGKAGDFFTAEQIQPVFGILMAAQVRHLYRQMGEPRDFSVVEVGAGRREMAEAFAEWNYLPVDIDSGAMPENFVGVVFSNEFFDALPADAAVYRDGAFHEQRVALEDGTFAWHTGEVVGDTAEHYLRRYYLPPQEGNWYEVNLEALAWLERMAKTLTKGYVFSIDYGFTRAESVRFPAGTLMGYRRHTAREDVLAEAGAARHHRARQLHRAPGERRRVWSRDRALRDVGTDSAGRRRSRSVRGGARRSQRGGRIASPHAA